MKRTREELITDIEDFTKFAEDYTKLAEKYTKFAEVFTKEAEYNTKWAEEARKELKQLDETNTMTITKEQADLVLELLKSEIYLTEGVLRNRNTEGITREVYRGQLEKLTELNNSIINQKDA